MGYFFIFCATVVAIIYLVLKYTCRHEWEIISTEYTETYAAIHQYKIFTKQCKKCGNVDVDKYEIN
jgi:hypothetical protein